MFASQCKECDGRLVIDILLTARRYDLDTGILINEDGVKDVKVLPDYLIFSCSKCGYSEKRSFEELKEILKLDILQMLLSVRQKAVYKNIDRSKILEENGISYCGLCYGVLDGDDSKFANVLFDEGERAYFKDMKEKQIKLIAELRK